MKKHLKIRKKLNRFDVIILDFTKNTNDLSILQGILEKLVADASEYLPEEEAVLVPSSSFLVPPGGPLLHSLLTHDDHLGVFGMELSADGALVALGKDE